MGIKIDILDFEGAEEYMGLSQEETSIVISISSFGETKAFIVPNSYSKIKDVLFLEFNDTDIEQDMRGPMMKDDALKIKEFIGKHTKGGKLQVDKLLIHCEEGRSRSIGITTALMEEYTGKPYDILNSDYYQPNLLCYNRMKEVYNKREEN